MQKIPERSSCLDTDLFFEIPQAADLYKDRIFCVSIEPRAEGHEGVILDDLFWIY